ncbi:hypothetical protein NVX60_004667 [Salmonella enterica]|nr:hypothetical protein [Salmonella enterica]EDL1762740.1 hypothetical protein [Salmonella enterica subsp. enterica serovar Poona]EEA7260023.1 hypothetical protein [Salmonella enterica subsp. enterica serovar Glostrup]EDK6782508.1 hypothetical protein [Salmonella enterica]EDY6475972.1 hypothetical protein [Salmonella enterica]
MPFDNLFDAAMSDADSRIIDVMGTTVQVVIAGQPRTIRGVFDEPAANAILPSGAASVDDIAPELFVKSADVDGITRRDSVIIGGINFWVTRAGPVDGDCRVLTLARGVPGKPQPEINKWSR